MRKCLPWGGGDLWRLDRLAFCSLHYRSESYRTTCWRSNAKPMSELRNQCTYYFMIRRLPAPSISVGLGTVEAGPPEASIIEGILWNNNFQCVINEHSDLGTHHRNPQNIWALGVMLPGSWRCILISSWVEQSQNYAFISEYCFISLSQNEGSKVHNVKVQCVIVSLKTSFLLSTLPTLISGRRWTPLWRLPVSPKLSTYPEEVGEKEISSLPSPCHFCSYNLHLCSTWKWGLT